MSYAFSWIILTPYVLSVWGILKGNFSFLYILKPFAGPTLAAIIMTGITEGKEGLLHLRDRLKQHRASWKWYLFILLGIPALILFGIVIQPGVLGSFQGLTSKILVSYPLYFVIVFFGVALPEEIGWRGFALPRMQPRYGPLWGTLLLGILWAFWNRSLWELFLHQLSSGDYAKIEAWAIKLSSIVMLLPSVCRRVFNLALH